MTIGGITSLGLQAAIHGLEARREAHEANIANVETPGYKARSVQFESALRRALDTGMSAPRAFEPTVNISNEAGRLNGNNVNVEQEMIGLTETALTQELLIRALNDKYGLVRTALGQG